MAHPKSSLDGLPPAWQLAITAHELQTTTLPLKPRKGSGPQEWEDSSLYLHSSELRVLIARIKGERIRRGLSLRDVARLTNQAHTAISRLESGQYPNPTLDTLYRYASALGMRITVTAKPLATDRSIDGDGKRTSGS